MDAYTTSYKACVKGTTISGIVTSSSSAPVTDECSAFDVIPTSSDAVQIAISKVPAKADVTLHNKTGDKQMFGIGDESGTAYLTVGTKNLDTAEFTCKFEFAVMVVANMKKGDMNLTGSTTLPYITFMADDVSVETINIKFDDNKLTVDGVVFVPLDSSVKLFAPKKA